MVFRMIHGSRIPRSYQWAKFGQLGLPGNTYSLTPWKFNMAPEKWWLEDYFCTCFFGSLLSRPSLFSSCPSSCCYRCGCASTSTQWFNERIMIHHERICSMLGGLESLKPLPHINHPSIQLNAHYLYHIMVKQP